MGMKAGLVFNPFDTITAYMPARTGPHSLKYKTIISVFIRIVGVVLLFFEHLRAGYVVFCFVLFLIL